MRSLVGQAVDDDADGEAEELVDLAHPLAVALGEVVVDGDDMDALAGERVEIDRQRRDQGLAFAGAHLGDARLVEHHAADQLDIEMPHAEHRRGRLADDGKGRHQQVVELGAIGDVLAEFRGAADQLLVGERPHLVFHGVDRLDTGPGRFDPTVVGGTENLTGETAETDHPMVLSIEFSILRRAPAGPINSA